MSKVLIGDSFTAAIYNYLHSQQYKAAGSAPRPVARPKKESHSNYFECMIYLFTYCGIVQPVANFSLHFYTVIVYMPRCVVSTLARKPTFM